MIKVDCVTCNAYIIVININIVIIIIIHLLFDVGDLKNGIWG